MGGPGGIVTERVDALLSSCPPGEVSDREFWGAQYDHGLAWVRFPEGLGGLGIDARWQSEVNRRIKEAGGPVSNWERNVVGMGMASATLIEHASPALCERLLRPLFTCEEIWCQLFSEPGAGSDLAGLATSAVADGGSWAVNGQKVWTTLAHVARWGLLLARTDPDVAKHRGLTYFVLDMDSDGVEVRPLFELTGEAEFNEVFLTDVRVPDANRLGEVGRGWSTAMTTLMSERASAGSEINHGGEGLLDHLLESWQSHPDRTPARRDAVMRVWIDVVVLKLTTSRAAAVSRTGTPGPEGSIAKLRWAELNQTATTLALNLLGPGGMLHRDGYRFERPVQSSVNSGSTTKAFLRARANTIEGGTSEIMRNVLAERVLGLPNDQREDREVAWRDVPR